MSPVDTLPLWAAIPAAVLLVAGAGFALLGSVGLVRLQSFYERIHAPTLATSVGIACVLLASVLVFAALGEGPILHEVVVGVFVLVTTPVTLMLLSRAALYRDRGIGAEPVPPPIVGDDADETGIDVRPV